MKAKLTPNEQSILDDLLSGLTRAECARKRGVTRPAISHAVKNMRKKGVAPPETPRPAPVSDTVHAMFRQGKTPVQVAAIMGFSPTYARFLKRKMEAER